MLDNFSTNPGDRKSRSERTGNLVADKELHILDMTIVLFSSQLILVRFDAHYHVVQS